MALATNFQSKNDVQIIWGTASALLGTAHAVEDAWLIPKTLEFSVPEASVALEMGSPANNTGVEFEDNAIHRLDTSTWTFTQSVICTDEVLKVIGKQFTNNGTSPWALTGALGLDGTGGYSVTHGIANTVANTVVFKGGGPSTTTQVDVVVSGCYMQSVSFKMDAGSNGGQLVADISWWTPYVPVNGSLVPDPVAAEDADEAANVFNITAESALLGGQIMMLLGWDFGLSRTLSKAGYQEGTSSVPWGICQTGVTECTGNLNVKRDDNTYALAANLLGNSAGVALSLTYSAPLFTLICGKVMINAPTIDSGSDYFTLNIPFRAVASLSDATAAVYTMTSL